MENFIFCVVDSHERMRKLLDSLFFFFGYSPTSSKLLLMKSVLYIKNIWKKGHFWKLLFITKKRHIKNEKYNSRYTRTVNDGINYFIKLSNIFQLCPLIISKFSYIPYWFSQSNDLAKFAKKKDLLTIFLNFLIHNV